MRSCLQWGQIMCQEKRLGPLELAKKGSLEGGKAPFFDAAGLKLGEAESSLPVIIATIPKNPQIYGDSALKVDGKTVVIPSTWERLKKAKSVLVSPLFHTARSAVSNHISVHP